MNIWNSAAKWASFIFSIKLSRKSHDKIKINWLNGSLTLIVVRSTLICISENNFLHWKRLRNRISLRSLSYERSLSIETLNWKQQYKLFLTRSIEWFYFLLVGQPTCVVARDFCKMRISGYKNDLLWKCICKCIFYCGSFYFLKIIFKYYCGREHSMITPEKAIEIYL